MIGKLRRNALKLYVAVRLAVDPQYRRQRAEYIRNYRLGWRNHREWRADDGGNTYHMLAGYSARHTFMASPVGAELAALGERVAEGEQVTA